MIPLALLLADAEWVKLAVFGVAILIYIINHLVGAVKKAQQQRPPPRPPMAAEVVPPARQQLNDELNEFLRRAGEKRAGGGPPPAAPRPPASRPSPRRPKRAEAPLEAQVVEERLERRHIKSSINTASFDQRAQSLTNLAKKEEQLEQQIEQKFSHKLGTLAGESELVAAKVAAEASPATPAVAAAAHLLELLASPQGVRDAVVLGEILSRPEHRW